jgi:hypothetical protein
MDKFTETRLNGKVGIGKFTMAPISPRVMEKWMQAVAIINYSKV